MPSLAAVYTGPARDRDAKLLIEQERWSTASGRITGLEVARWLGAVVDERHYELAVDCDVSEGKLHCVINAYPLEPGLAYALLTSWGLLSARRVAMVEIRDEQVQFRMEDTARTRYPARSISSVAWTVECLDREGSVVPPPALTIHGETVRSGQPVYGTASVSYLCERHVHTLDIPRRDSAIDHHFSAALIGLVPGFAPVVHAVSMPPGIETFEQDGEATCGRTSTAALDWPDRQPLPPSPSLADKITEQDYCTREIVREYTR